MRDTRIFPEADRSPLLIVQWGALKKVPHFSLRFFGAKTAPRRSQWGCAVAKKWKNRVMHSGAVLLALIGLLMLADECRAFPYRPAAALSILSEYAAFNDSAPRHTQVWKVVPEVGSDGASILRFFLEASAEAIPVCELSLPAPGAAG